MSKHPKLRVIQGTRETADGGIYRLRPDSVRQVQMSALEWPRAGAWRQMIHRLMRNPVASQ
jgi:hypothetical protein